MSKFSLFAIWVFVSLQFSSASAAEPVRIMTGGPTTAKKIAPIEDALEKAVGGPIEVSVNPIDVGMEALSKGVIDAVVGPLEESFASGEKRLKTKLNRDEYEWTVISQSPLNIGVHPSNPTSSLTKDQVTDILSGKIKNWDVINGQKLPITVLIAKNYVAASKSLAQFYLHADTSPVAQYVLNKDGLIGGLKNNPGAIGFFTAKETHPDFSPKFFASHVTNTNYFIMKKPARPAAQKVFDYFKEHPKALQD
jgi:hypothetical protein